MTAIQPNLMMDAGPPPDVHFQARGPQQTKAGKKRNRVEQGLSKLEQQASPRLNAST